MALNKTELLTFNRGLISPLAQARVDIERVALSAETYTNFMPRNLGSMMLRPGTAYIGNTASDNAAKLIPFVFSTTDTAICEITDSLMRVWVNDALVTRPAVTSATSNGDFDNGTPLLNWTDNDEAGAASTRTNVSATHYMTLLGTGATAAIRTQEVTTVETSTEHTLDIKVGEPDIAGFLGTGYLAGSPVTLRVGSTDGDDDYIAETQLDVGYHSLSFTPTGNFWIQFSNREKRNAHVNSCHVASSGTFTITTPWAAADLDLIRWDQSGDILYIACGKTTDSIGYPAYKIERRGTTSWSVVKYEPEDGPFNTINTGPVTVATSVLTTASTLTASGPLFKVGMEGSLFKISSIGQTVSVANIGAEDTWTDPIKVTGVTSARIFTVTIEDRTDSTVTLQRSLTADDGPWESLTPTYTANNTFTYDDTLDNQTAWYRIGVATGDYGTDAIDLTLDYPLGSIDGIARIYQVQTSTTAVCQIIKDFGAVAATDDWYLGEWSDLRGHPTAVGLVEGRLGWAGKNKVLLSESDAYEDFDIETIGDSGPITRTIGQGPVDNINFLVALKRLIYGTDSAEWSLRSSGEDEPLTPTNASPKIFSTQGSATVNPAKMDDTALYIQRGGTRLYEAAMNPNTYELESNDLTVLYPEAGDSQIVRMAIQRQPDTRIHCVRADGSVVVLLHDPAEDVSGWVKLTVPGTSAAVEDVVVLPGADGSSEDAVYYIVVRTVNSSTVRFLERWSLESENVGGATSKSLDSHITGTVTGGTLTGLTHLEGETVAAWVNGADVGTYTVTSGQITGVTADGAACVGLPYTAQFKSMKLGGLTMKKNIKRLGLILRNTHYQGLEYGADFTHLDHLPMVKDGSTVADDTVHSTFDEESFSLSGIWDSDTRLCLQAASPRPVTVLAAIVEFEG